MKILRNYILRECVTPFLLSLGVLTCVFLLGNLIRLANMVINKGVSLNLIGKIFVLYIPLLLGYTLPIACLVTVILTFSRFSADNEILAIRASGIHLRKLLAPLIALGIIVSLFSIVLNEKIIPYAHHEQRKLFKNIGASNPTAILEAGSFINAFKDQIIFIYKIEGNRLYNIHIYQPQPDNKPTRTIIAREGEFTPVPGENKIKLKLMNGTSDEPNFENPNSFYKLNFKNYFMTLDLSGGEKQKVDKKPKGMTLKELSDKIKTFDKISVDSSPLIAEYHRKISWSFSAFLFILLGFPIAVITHRRERSANVGLAVLCAAAYYLLSLGCEGLSIQNITPPAITMWIPNIVGGAIAIFLNYKLCKS
ncbi:MAG TPA: LptF/LptG family permease [Candidatus Omnitrophota bacterium]|nr:LptF/LptG family permease [Candidatus Omnitrophota bacterium]HPD84802.1 LptF/LptG family permease [Candidatus Omnitrophota bacterium]HRZ03660.1 LptF/LptG family permease [Candidatus Omnitrophota bacterium]